MATGSKRRAMRAAGQSRRDLLGSLYRWFGLGGRRDLPTVLGYDPDLDYDKYLARYARGGIAGRIVEIPAEATWETLPSLVEDATLLEETAITKKFAEIAKRVQLRRMLERADRLAGIGRYAIALIGFRDGKPLDEPVAENSVGADGVLYVAPFSEKYAIPSRIELDPKSPLYGGPSHYAVDFARGALEQQDPAISAWIKRFVGGFTTQNRPEVHASRIVHLAEGELEDGLYGLPRLRRVYDLLDDLAKTVGGSAEIFWNTADRGMQFDVDKDMTLSKEAEENLEKQIEEYYDGLRRAFQTRGMSIKGLNELGAGNVNPRPVFQCVSALITGTTGIPFRMLFGTERGQNINEQDRKAWLEQVWRRRATYGSEVVVWPFIERLVYAGALPKLALEAHLAWPPVHDDAHQANVADTVSRAELNHAKAVQMGAASIGEGEWRSNFLGLPRELSKGDRFGKAKPAAPRSTPAAELNGHSPDRTPAEMNGATH